MEELLKEFEAYICRSQPDHFFDTVTVFTRTQRPAEKVCDYVATMQKLVSQRRYV